MTEEKLFSLFPLFKGELKDAIASLSEYPELGRLEIGAIRKVLGYSGEVNTKLNDEQRKAIVEEYKTGETSMRKLAKKYGINLTGIRGILIRRKIDTSPKDRWTKFKKLKLINLRKAHHSYSDIARQMGLTTTAIVHHAHKLGFPKDKSGLDPFVQVFQPNLDDD